MEQELVIPGIFDIGGVTIKFRRCLEFAFLGQVSQEVNLTLQLNFSWVKFDARLTSYDEQLLRARAGHNTRSSRGHLGIALFLKTM